MEAWHKHDEVDESDEWMAFGAGVALAAHVTDDTVTSTPLIYDEVVDTVSGQEKKIPEPTRAVLEAMTGDDTEDTPTSAQLRERADEEDGLDALEHEAFAHLLEEELE